MIEKINTTTTELVLPTTHEVTVTKNTAPVVWKKTGAEPVIIADGVHLGRKLDSSGNGAGFVDSSETPVPGAGIAVIVEQASYGYTGIAVKPVEGFTVEALRVDEETQVSKWVGAPYEGANVKVVSDRGKLPKMPLRDALDQGVNLGTEGGRAGVIRVVEQEGETRYYAIGADFEGEPDNWTVRGAMVEVTPAAPGERPILPGVRLELPNGE